MLLNLKDILEYAKVNQSAIGSFNVYNLESIQAVVQAALAAKQPVIISFGESYTSHAPIEVIAEIVKIYCIKSDVPFCLHLDHSKELATIMKAIRAGFTSIMYDGSALPLNENIRRSRQVVELSHLVGVSVEGELGYMNNEDGTSPDGLCLAEGYTTVAAAKEYTEQSGVDALAIAIGNAHGIYKGIPTLDFLRLEEIKRTIKVPIVLHGSSGIPLDSLRKAISLGVRKININTEVSTKGIQTARSFLADHLDKNTRFEILAKAVEGAMSQTVAEYINLFK
ncbi:fructose-bisphosphate aldolase, class II [Propionispira arboris]|uniref:Fructose-bisphosphate aldolase, class II n=1 Tax=Propionispira arboris TaxID=84035 RepID=A0A1H6TPU5_9FIRM|nr:class II fructose-bisphosphate aldolase [Propionispira arboris]SEI78280.1 fructose-bisphosphate aldolase, class II [Propionispira arboris]